MIMMSGLTTTMTPTLMMSRPRKMLMDRCLVIESIEILQPIGKPVDSAGA